LEAGRSSEARSSTHHVIPFVGCPTNELVWSARQQDRTQLSGKPATFLLAALIVVVWAVTGRVFHYSDTWQLVINAGTTIITFLMVFLMPVPSHDEYAEVIVILGPVGSTSGYPRERDGTTHLLCEGRLFTQPRRLLSERTFPRFMRANSCVEFSRSSCLLQRVEDSVSQQGRPVPSRYSASRRHYITAFLGGLHHQYCRI